MIIEIGFFTLYSLIDFMVAPFSDPLVGYKKLYNIDPRLSIIIRFFYDIFSKTILPVDFCFLKCYNFIGKEVSKMKMKTLKFISGLCLGLVLLFTLTACGASVFPKVKKSFEDAGWTYSQELADSYKNAVESSKKDGEAKEVIVTVHAFKKDLINFAIVFEFKSTKEMDEAIENSATLRGALEDAQKSELVNRNCFLLPIGITIDSDEIIKIFQGK